ncbi:hypothetical protein BJAS_P4313 [Bathymodiolus japonicus methanotrophic gill symbiont]|nr:hypothetical protein BJAS_P4313 [Bathymodiolus japonicus methanotrophic gill symbiont]
MKLLTLGGTALLTFFATVNVNAESSVGYEEATFEMGGQGPAGGVIFYLTDDKLHGMESAGYLKDSQGLYMLAEWGCNDIYKDVGFGVKLGEGKANSLELLEECSSDRGGLIAAKHADNYVQNQYSDWYLPSQDELSKYSYLMWESGRKVVNSSADIEHYCTWSSTNYFWNAIGAGYAQGMTQEFDEYYSLYTSGRARSKECAIVPVRDF